MWEKDRVARSSLCTYIAKKDSEVIRCLLSPPFFCPSPSCQAPKQKVSRGGGNGSGQKVPPFSVNIKRFRPGAAERKREPAWVRWRRRWCRCPGGREREEKSRPQSGAYSPKVLAIPIPEPCLGPIGRDAAETSNMEYSFR